MSWRVSRNFMSNDPDEVLKVRSSKPHPGLLNEKILQESPTGVMTRPLGRNSYYSLDDNISFLLINLVP